jgi:hypothetical protein
MYEGLCVLNRSSVQRRRTAGFCIFIIIKNETLCGFVLVFVVQVQAIESQNIAQELPGTSKRSSMLLFVFLLSSQCFHFPSTMAIVSISKQDASGEPSQTGYNTN